MGRAVVSETIKKAFRAIPNGLVLRETPKVRIHESVLLDILEPLKSYAENETAKKANPKLKLVEKKQ